MASKSKSTDQTSSSNKTNVVDRRVVQERGQQILDSIIQTTDDKVVRAAMAEASVMVANLANANSASVSSLLAMVDKIATMANKNQLELSAFQLRMVEDARRDLRDLMDSGNVVIQLADKTVGQAMNMAATVARDQAKANATALEIVADMKSGDPADMIKQLSAMVMGFALLAMIIQKGR